ncbi:MAG: hypothetical protein ACHQ4J_12765 [Candidatus Binatia bacterium]
MTDHFEAFAAAVESRLQQCAKTYGDRSFRQAPDVLAGEVEQELLDVCAWSFILWCRIRALRERLSRCKVLR